MFHQNENRLLRAVTATGIGFMMLWFAWKVKVEHVGIALEITSSTTRYALILLGGLFVLIGGFLFIFEFIRPEVTELVSGSQPSLRPEIQRALAFLDDQTGFDRIDTITEIRDILPNDLSASEITLILGPLDGIHYKQAVQILAAKIRGS